MDSSTTSAITLAVMALCVGCLFASIWAWERWSVGWRLRWAIQGVRQWIALKIAPWLAARDARIDDFVSSRD